VIGLDTNVLLRALMDDDPADTPRAKTFLAGLTNEVPGVVNTVVLAELVWSLRTAYAMPRAEIAGILRDMTESGAYAFENRDAVLRALHDYEGGSSSFTDRLIAEINEELGCTATVTFDQGALPHPPFVPVPS